MGSLDVANRSCTYRGVVSLPAVVVRDRYKIDSRFL